jgi:uncharacterized ferritin-like protein (DUF455 family)
MNDATPRRPEFADGPARDARFQVAEFWADCVNLPPGHPEREAEFFHRQMNEEINGMECAARALTDFPDADWPLRMAIARQCCDEARHVQMFREALESRGGHVGQSPVLNFQYRIITRIDDLCGRLAVQNRSFEVEGVDAIEPEIAAAAERGDPTMAHRYDAQLADEIGHVRFANEYLAQVMARDPGAVMRVGRALNYAFEAFAYVMGQHAMASVSYGINEQGRREAGFREEEIAQASVVRAARRARTQAT